MYSLYVLVIALVWLWSPSNCNGGSLNRSDGLIYKYLPAALRAVVKLRSCAFYPENELLPNLVCVALFQVLLQYGSNSWAMCTWGHKRNLNTLIYFPNNLWHYWCHGSRLDSPQETKLFQWLKWPSGVIPIYFIGIILLIDLFCSCAVFCPLF